MCALLGHKPVILDDAAYCGRCGKDGFMQIIRKENGTIVEYGIDESPTPH